MRLLWRENVSDPPSDSSSDKACLRSRSRRRRWLFRLLAVCLSLTPFILLEVGLRVFGYGNDTRLVVRVPHADASDTYRLNPTVDSAYYGVENLPGPEPRTFKIPRPKGVYRIVVVGGSSVAGFPYAFELAMPRQLQLVLNGQSPDRQFEVLNAGITAINSFSEVDVVRQAIDCDPDLIVVHSGHNEFYGPGGLASTASRFSPKFYPLLQRLRRQRVFQLGASLIRRPANTHLLETLPADKSIPLDSRMVVRVEECYQVNLQNAVNVAGKAGVPILLTTVPSNLRDLSPMQSIPRRDLTDQQKLEQAERWKKASRHLSYQEFEPALSALRAARQLEPANAILAYREAQCLEMLERNDEAAEAYVLACDLDGCRFRAPSSFQSIVRDVASGGSGSVFFCDVAGQLRDQSSLPAPGNDFFLEHVHYNLEGHWHVAMILGRFIHKQILGAGWQSERVPSVERRDELLGVTPFDYLMADSIGLMTFEICPLKLAPDSAQQAELAKARMRRIYATLSPLDREVFANLSLATMQRELLVAMGNGYVDAGRQDLAAQMYETHILRRPWEVSGYISAAAVQKRLGNLGAAKRFLEKARRIAPSDREVRKLEQSISP